MLIETKVLTSKFYHELRSACRSAKEKVWFMSYVLSGNFKRKSDPVYVLLKILEIKQKQGLDVRFILDSPKHGRPNFHTNRVYSRRLFDLGIPFGLPESYLTCHAKCCCVDGSLLFCGSHNLTKHSLFNRLDVTLSTTEPGAIDSFEVYFEDVWRDPALKKYPPNVMDFDRIYP